MSRSVEVLDQIAKSETAVFAFDANDLVILWNKGCEKLLGRSAYQVLGRHCYDIMGGRDMYGNLYCCPNCPITVQAREHPRDPVQTLRARCLDRRRRHPPRGHNHVRHSRTAAFARDSGARDPHPRAERLAARG